MAEVIARIAVDGRVELVDEKMQRIGDPMTPVEAAFLARNLLSCAAAMHASNKPKEGTIVADAQLPVLKCSLATASPSTDHVLKLSVPSDVELSFRISLPNLRALYEGLVAFFGGKPSQPTPPRNEVH